MEISITKIDLASIAIVVIMISIGIVTYRNLGPKKSLFDDFGPFLLMGSIFAGVLQFGGCVYGCHLESKAEEVRFLAEKEAIVDGMPKEWQSIYRGICEEHDIIIRKVLMNKFLATSDRPSLSLQEFKRFLGVWSRQDGWKDYIGENLERHLDVEMFERKKD